MLFVRRRMRHELFIRRRRAGPARDRLRSRRSITMKASRVAMTRLAAVLSLATACGSSDHGDRPGGNENGSDGGSSNGGSPPTVGSEAGAGLEATSSFAACGGAIVDGAGGIDPTEYKKQAVLWDRSTIDCRF